MNGSDRPGDFGVVHNGSGKTAKVALGFDLVPSLGVVGDLLGKTDQAERTIGHETKNVLRLDKDLGRLGTVDGIKVGIVLQAMLAGGGKHHGHTLHRRGVGYRPPLPLDDPVRAKVHLEFAPVVGRDDVATGSEARFLQVVFWLEVDQFVEPRDMFLRRNAPNAGGRRSGDQLNAFRQWTKEQVVVHEIALAGIQVGPKPALVLHPPL